MTDLLFKKWCDLDFRTALFQRAFRDKKLIKRINSQKLSSGFEILRIALAESVIICAASILKGRDKKELSLNNIVPHFRDKNAQLYDSIKSGYVAALSDDHDKNELDKIFEDSGEKLVRKYQSLEKSKAYKNLISMRDKAFAHFEMKTIENKRQVHTATDFPIKFNEIDQIVSKVGKLICDCEYLLKYTSTAMKSYSRENKKNASGFWNKAFPRVR